MDALKSAKKLSVFDTPLYLVGGAVRNRILGLPVKDFDLAGAIPTQTVLNKFRKISAETTNKLFTCVITLDGYTFEYTPFRIDSYKGGAHRPQSVVFTDDMASDALRRDFTCNAIYLNVESEELIDPLGGIKDIENKLLRTVTAPDKVLGEDGLRLLRLVRFASELGFTIEENTLDGAKKNASLIDDIAAERVRDELNKILVADTAYGRKNAHVHGLKLLVDIGLMERILPEIYQGKGIKQRSDFHKYDVLGHTLKTVEYASPEVRLAALLHDVAKPYCLKHQGNMYGHDKKGAAMAKEILSRLKYPNSVIHCISKLIELHMYDLSNQAKDSTLRKFIQKNYKFIPMLLQLKQADYLGSGLTTGISPSVDRMQRILEEMKAENIPLSTKGLAVDGNDLIELGIPPAKRGIALTALLENAVQGQEMLERTKQLEFLQQFSEKDATSGI